MTQKMTFDFDTSAYKWTHGKQPSGYGAWAFTFTAYSDNGGTDRSDEIFWAPSSTLTDAKKWMKQQVKVLAPDDFRGHVEVQVCT